MLLPPMCRARFNPFFETMPEWPSEIVTAFGRDDISECHRSFAQYHPIPLLSLSTLAKKLKLGSILVKDEAHRFGLNAFKVLGASYAIYCFLKEAGPKLRLQPLDFPRLIQDRADHQYAHRFTFCTATDGNHGRAVAWTARQVSQQAVIYMPQGTVSASAGPPPGG